MRRKLVADNPFADLASAVRGNPSRFYFVTRDDAAKVLDACTDAERRLLFTLSRFGGLRTPSESLALQWLVDPAATEKRRLLRTPSESLALQWGDIDWANNRIRVPSPKTEHIEGKESRLIPMFPEMRPHLEAVFEQAEPGTEYAITRYRGGGVNLRTQPSRIVRRAGLQPWGKLWQNLRSTRETELMESYPAHVVCGWIGNSEAVARKHYLQTTDDHFERAIQGGHDAAQKAAQQAHAASRTESQCNDGAHEKVPALPELATSCDYLPLRPVPLRGVEPDDTSVCNARDLGNPSGGGAAESGAVSVDSALGELLHGGAEHCGFEAILGKLDRDLAAVVEAWPKLSEAARRAVAKIVSDALHEDPLAG